MMGGRLAEQSGASQAPTNELPTVEALGVGKKFAKSLGQALRYGVADIASEFLFAPSGIKDLRPGEFWALDNVSFEVRPGEALAVIGRNGSGKSTLLKLLYGLIKPDTGHITIRGRMAALIELGAGFDPILSGRENVYINASILGLSREEVDDLMPKIIEFSGLRDFMETPVKFYSSGMRARLAYSIATNLEPEIFLVDEVLAVGDSEFRQKCLRNMVRFVEEGGSLVFVSHMAHQVQMACTRGVVLDAGKLVCQGTTLEALDYYYRSDLLLPSSETTAFTPQAADCNLVSLEIQGAECGGPIRTGESLSISITAELQREAEVVATISILARDLVTVVASESSGQPRSRFPGRHVFQFHIPALPLMPGLFHVRAALREGEQLLPLATFGIDQPPTSFLVKGDPTPENIMAQSRGQLVRIEGTWS